MPTRKYPFGYKKKREIKWKNKINIKNELWINLLLTLKKTQKKKKQKKINKYYFINI